MILLAYHIQCDIPVPEEKLVRMRGGNDAVFSGTSSRHDDAAMFASVSSVMFRYVTRMPLSDWLSDLCSAVAMPTHGNELSDCALLKQTSYFLSIPVCIVFVIDIFIFYKLHLFVKFLCWSS